MKKLLALIALVAMVAVSSVAFAQDTEDLDASVGLGDSLSIDETDGATPCGTSELDDLTALVGPTTGTDECTFTLTANIDFDLYIEGAASALEATDVGNTDEIAYAADGTDLTTAGADEAGYYLVDDGANLTAGDCVAATDVCNPTNAAASYGWTAETTHVTEEDMTAGLAVSIDVLTPDSYTDTWTLSADAA